MSMKEIKLTKEERIIPKVIRRSLPAAPEPFMIKENSFTVFKPKTALNKEVNSSLRPPLSKEQFCSCIKAIQDHWTRVIGAEKIFGMNFETFPSTIIFSYVELLVTLMRDQGRKYNHCTGNPWIYDFCFRSNFGQNEAENLVYKGKYITTAAELYNALVEAYWEKPHN